VDFLQGILKDKAGDLMGELTGKAGFSADQAEKFMPEAGSAVMDAMKSQASNLDLENLSAPGNVQALTEGIDTGALASKAGLSPEQSAGGIKAMLPMLLGFIGAKSGGASGLMGMLTGTPGGMLGKLGGLMGK